MTLLPHPLTAAASLPHRTRPDAPVVLAPLRWITPAAPQRFLLLLKPELFADGVDIGGALSLVAEHLHRHAVTLGGICWWTGADAGRRDLPARLYPRLYSVSRRGADALAPSHRSTLAALGATAVRGGAQFLHAHPSLGAEALCRWSDRVGGTKVGSGVYAVRLGSEVVLNAFAPFHESWLSQPAGHLLGLECFTARSWATLRAELVGGVDPGRAPSGSIRRALADRSGALGLMTTGIAFNGVHVSPGPIEAEAQLRAVFGVSAAEGGGRGPLADRAGPALARILDDPLLSDGTPLFERTEDMDLLAALTLVEEAC